MNKAFTFHWRKPHQRTTMNFHVFGSINIFESVEYLYLWREQVPEVIENIVVHVYYKF